MKITKFEKSEQESIKGYSFRKLDILDIVNKYIVNESEAKKITDKLSDCYIAFKSQELTRYFCEITLYKTNLINISANEMVEKQRLYQLILDEKITPEILWYIIAKNYCNAHRLIRVLINSNIYDAFQNNKFSMTLFLHLSDSICRSGKGA